MLVYPVIMCGGSGTRLWPASRPSMPKQFLPLLGELSSFQATIERVVGIKDVAQPLIVAGVRHEATIRRQLAEIGVEAALLLEPEARDSAAAVAAAAAWVHARDPQAVLVILAADHHVPDAAAFRRAIEETVAAAAAGSIVTLGIKPTAPATAYGYIRPAAAGQGVRPVAAFVEKPNEERARQYIADGCLWNSGYFIGTAQTLLEELDAFAPDIADAARAGVSEGKLTGSAQTLSPAFTGARKTSIDYAVMEKTKRVAVLAVDFDWSDLGAWDAVWEASDRDADGVSRPAGAQAIGSKNLLVRAPDHIHVAVIGADNLAVIVEPDAVLVCHLGQTQAVKTAAGAAPASARTFATLEAADTWARRWLATAALPVWATLGQDSVTGGFREALTLDGKAHDAQRRTRVQGRQAFVFARAAEAGFSGPWLEAARRGMAHFLSTARRADGLFSTLTSPEGRVLDSEAMLYDQAFVLFALAALHDVDGNPRWAVEAAQLRGALENLRHPLGGFRENGDRTYQANAHMHLLEASLEWEAASGDLGWSRLADETAELAMRCFIGKEGALREFFDENWVALTGPEDDVIEPGHQFEWAWLMERWGRLRDRADARAVARRLFAVGKRGFDAARGVAVNALNGDLSMRDAQARLWPQTEYLKAALILHEQEDALIAMQALARYLDVGTRGLWRDKLRLDGSFADEASPASSLYHIYIAFQELSRAVSGQLNREARQAA